MFYVYLGCVDGVFGLLLYGDVGGCFYVFGEGVIYLYWFVDVGEIVYFVCVLVVDVVFYVDGVVYGDGCIDGFDYFLLVIGVYDGGEFVIGDVVVVCW